MSRFSLVVYTLVGFTLGTGLTYLDLALSNIRSLTLSLLLVTIVVSVYSIIQTVKTKRLISLKLALISTACVVVAVVSSLSVGLVMVTISWI